MADKEEPKKKQSTIKQIIQIFKYTHAEDKALPWLCGGVFVAPIVVFDDEAERMSISRINGERSVSLDVYKTQDANVVETGDAIKHAAENMRAPIRNISSCAR